MELGNIDTARDCFLEAVKLDPTSENSLLALADFYLETNDMAAFDAELERAKGLDAGIYEDLLQAKRDHLNEPSTTHEPE